MSAAPRLTQATRWSAAAKCPRWAALGGLGSEPAAPTDTHKRYWARGKALGRYVADSYAERYGEEGIIREKAVPWSAGVLHGDVFVISESLPVEVKLTTSPASILDDALLQLAGQIHFDPDADTLGVLELIEPSSYERSSIPFRLTDQWRERVERRSDEVVKALATADLPECVCETPAACARKFCPYTSVAWENWVPPPRAQVAAEHADLILELYLAKQRRDERGAEAKLEADRYRELCAQLADYLEPGVEYESGAIKVKRTAVKPRETFSLTTARKAGLWQPAHDEVFASCIKVGEPHDRFSVVRGEGELLAADSFGEAVPF